MKYVFQIFVTLNILCLNALRKCKSITLTEIKYPLTQQYRTSDVHTHVK